MHQPTYSIRNRFSTMKHERAGVGAEKHGSLQCLASCSPACRPLSTPPTPLRYFSRLLTHLLKLKLNCLVYTNVWSISKDSALFPPAPTDTPATKAEMHPRWCAVHTVHCTLCSYGTLSAGQQAQTTRSIGWLLSDAKKCTKWRPVNEKFALL